MVMPKRLEWIYQRWPGDKWVWSRCVWYENSVNKYRNPKKQSRMDNPDTQATLGTRHITKTNKIKTYRHNTANK